MTLSGGLTQCRELRLRPSSLREHVNASSNHKLFIKSGTAQLLSRKSKITSGLTVLKRSCKEPGKISVSHR